MAEKMEGEAASSVPAVVGKNFQETVEAGRDLPMTEEQYERRRTALLSFIGRQLTEATYDSRGYPDMCNDYYAVPGSRQKALTRKGAECLGDHFRYKVFRSEVTEQILEPDFVSVRARVALHRNGVVMAEREGACTTAEAGFQRMGMRKKYGARYNQKKEETKAPDYRAALNDIVARAQKRAYVNAMIAACAAGDILAVAEEGSWQVDGDGVLKEGVVVEATVVEDDTAPFTTWDAWRERLLVLGKHPAFGKEEQSKLATWLEKPRPVERLEDTKLAMEARIADHASTPESGDPV